MLPEDIAANQASTVILKGLTALGYDPKKGRA
jgi:hypothetical protein